MNVATCDPPSDTRHTDSWIRAFAETLPESTWTHERDSSQLDPPDSNDTSFANTLGGCTQQAALLATRFRHSGWANRRQAVFDAFHRTNASESSMKAFADCGSHAYVLRSVDEPGKYRVAGSICRNRWCSPCANSRARRIRTNVIGVIQNHTTRFLTLTTAANGSSLQSRLNHLYDSFKALRHTKLWKDGVTGGVAFLEVKHSNRTGDWHPHLHCLIQGTWIDKREISKEWNRITGNSKIINISLIKNENHAGRYVTKYASKPLNSTLMETTTILDEAIVAMRKRRLVYTFGDWRGLLLTKADTDGEWENIGSINEWITRALNGDVEAIKVVQSVYPNSQDTFRHVVPSARPPPTSSGIEQHQLSMFHTFNDGRTVLPTEDITTSTSQTNGEKYHKTLERVYARTSPRRESLRQE